MSFFSRVVPSVARRLVHSSVRRQASVTANVNSQARQVTENVIKDETETHSASYLSFLFFVAHPVAAAGTFAYLNSQGQGYGLGH